MSNYQWELDALDTLDPYIPGPATLPKTVDDWWGVHGGQGEPSTKIWRYSELRAFYDDEELVKITEVARLVEAVWCNG